MPNTMQENVEFLEQAKGAVAELDSLKRDAAGKEQALKKLTKSFEAEKRAVMDSIETAVKKRRAEINAEYDSQTAAADAEIKKVNTERSRVRAEAQKSRIETETASLQEEIQRLKDAITAMYKESGVPAYCRTTLFSALHDPKTLGEISLAILMLLLCFFAIPVGLYLLVGKGKTLWLILIYVADILLFGGAYVLVNNRTRVKHNDILTQGRQMRTKIQADKKQIRAIESGIRKDKNESMYGLEAFDAQLNQLEQQKASVQQAKEAALKCFEDSGKVQISDEITANNRERIARLEAEVGAAAAALNGTKDSLNAAAGNLSRNFEPALGKDFLDTGRLDNMIAYFKAGSVKDLAEAQQFVRMGNKAVKKLLEERAAAEAAAPAAQPAAVPVPEIPAPKPELVLPEPEPAEETAFTPELVLPESPAEEAAAAETAEAQKDCAAAEDPGKDS